MADTRTGHAVIVPLANIGKVILFSTVLTGLTFIQRLKNYLSEYHCISCCTGTDNWPAPLID